MIRFILILISSITLTAAHAEEKRITAPYKKPAKKAAPVKTEEKKEEPTPAATDPKPESEEESVWEKVKDKSVEAGEAAEKGVKKATKSLSLARERRGERDWTITGNYQVFEMWVLTKYGFTIGYNRSQSSTYEFEYMHGSIGVGKFGVSLAEISETRMSLLWRSYGSRNSFNFFSGIYYNELEAGYGSDWLTSVPGGYAELVSIKTLGISWGLGNRWITKGGFVWGFDWFHMNIPVVVLNSDNAFIDATTDAQDREDAREAQDWFERFPEFAALKIQLGFSW